MPLAWIGYTFGNRYTVAAWNQTHFMPHLAEARQLQI
jgi:hypothetical protein